MADLHNVEGMLPVSLRTWSTYLLFGRPGRRFQSWQGRRPSDRSTWAWRAWWAGTSSLKSGYMANSTLPSPFAGFEGPLWDRVKRGKRKGMAENTATINVCSRRCMKSYQNENITGNISVVLYLQDFMLQPASTRLVSKTAVYCVRTCSCCHLVPYWHSCWKCPSFSSCHTPLASRCLLPAFSRSSI